MVIQPFELLEFRSKSTPSSLAIKDSQFELSFTETYSLARKIATELAHLGIRKNQLVVTILPGAWDWIFNLSLFGQAVVVCSKPDFTPLDFEADWVISHKPFPGIDSKRNIVVNDQWIQNAKKRFELVPPQYYESEQSICKLIFTSATTGTAKYVEFTLAALEKRMQRLPMYWSNGLRELDFMGLSTVGGFFSALFALYSGNTYYCVRSFQEEAVKFVEENSIEILAATPVQISLFLEAVKKLNAKPSSLRFVKSAGSLASTGLISSVNEILNVPLINVYGSTEGGGVTMRIAENDGFNVGYPLPGVEIQIVDESGNQVSSGLEGFIKYKTPQIVSKYFMNEVETKRSFADGWFFPGDTGKILYDGSLKLTGRSSEIINLGGMKIDPNRIDDFTLKFSGVLDCAAVGFEDRFGLVNLALALVVSEDFDLNALKKELLTNFAECTPSVYKTVESIPRNHMGKVIRQEVSKFFALPAEN